jgi:hypothetical protein
MRIIVIALGIFAAASGVAAALVNGAQPGQRWTYECFATFGAAVEHLNKLQPGEALAAKMVGYDNGFLSHCVVFRK